MPATSRLPDTNQPARCSCIPCPSLSRMLQESQSQAELAASASASQQNPEAERLLREDVEAAHQEVVVAQEHEQMCTLEVGELQRQRNELRERVQEIEDAHRAVSRGCREAECLSSWGLGMFGDSQGSHRSWHPCPPAAIQDPQHISRQCLFSTAQVRVTLALHCLATVHPGWVCLHASCGRSPVPDSSCVCLCRRCSPSWTHCTMT